MTDAKLVVPPENYPGWKTQYTAIVPGSYSSAPVQFYGFGNCPFNSNLSSEFLLQNATSSDDFISFYLDILRLGCIRTIEPLIKQVFKSGVLILSESTKKFQVQSDHKYL